MPARAARTGAARRSVKRKATGAYEVQPRAAAADQPDADDWVEIEHDRERLDEGEMEMLLTGHAATHGNEGEDNWLLETEEVKWGER
ncbi:MAG: hypothetical protein IT531_19400 [Burkholderiales bacterium]|nr:hypothetical protein [Burkholderiales bacterium]